MARQLDYKRITDAVEHRMQELGLNQTTAAQRAGVSRDLFGAKLLTGKPWSIRADKLGLIEAALEWPPGAIRAIGQGADPAELAEQFVGDWRATIDDRLDRIEQMLASLLEMQGRSGARR